MRDRLMIDALREGMGTWQEPLTLYITNMGEEGGSPVFWEEKKLADKVKKTPAKFPHYRQYSSSPKIRAMAKACQDARLNGLPRKRPAVSFSRRS